MLWESLAMPDPTMVQWADGSLHHPSGGKHQETDELVADLSSDARLPRQSDELTDEQKLQERLKDTVDTAGKMMRAAKHGQSALSNARLFDCLDKDGKPLPAEPISWRDGAAVQILKRLAAQVRKLELTPLDEEQGETELDREVKIAQILTMMTKQQAAMELSIAKAVGLSTKASQQAAELSFKIRAHQDKMSLLKDKELSAAEVEKIADG